MNTAEDKMSRAFLIVAATVATCVIAAAGLVAWIFWQIGSAVL